MVVVAGADSVGTETAEVATSCAGPWSGGRPCLAWRMIERMNSASSAPSNGIHTLLYVSTRSGQMIHPNT